MRFSILVLIFAAIISVGGPMTSRADSIDGSVTQIELPPEDVTLFYVERKGGFTVKMETDTAAVEGQKFYIGDGKIAIDLIAHPSKGIFLQGVHYRQGEKFKKGSAIKVRPGYKKASTLRPGDIYVTLPAVLFKLPEK